jgi:hypothetical protein
MSHAARGRDVVRRGGGSGDGPNLVRNGSTVHHGDAMTGGRRFDPSAVPDVSRYSWHQLHGYPYFNFTAVVEDSLD